MKKPLRRNNFYHTSLFILSVPKNWTSQADQRRFAGIELTNLATCLGTITLNRNVTPIAKSDTRSVRTAIDYFLRFLFVDAVAQATSGKLCGSTRTQGGPENRRTSCIRAFKLSMQNSSFCQSTRLIQIWSLPYPKGKLIWCHTFFSQQRSTKRGDQHELWALDGITFTLSSYLSSSYHIDDALNRTIF